MPTLVRNLNNGAWLDYVDEAPGELQADALKNFKTKNNKLSVFEVASGECNAERLAVAVAASADYLDKVDFVVFDHHLPTKLNISIDKTAGGTHDQQANALHFNLLILTAKKLCGLAEAICCSSQAQRIQKPDVARRLLRAIDNGLIDENDLKKSMQADLKKFRSRSTTGGNQ